MSASTEASKSSASASPASAWRTTPTPSGRAGIVSRTSGGTVVIGSSARAVAPRGCDRLVATAQHGKHRHEAGDVEDSLHPGLDGLADADHEALAGLERAPARVQQCPEDG